MATRSIHGPLFVFVALAACSQKAGAPPPSPSDEGGSGGVVSAAGGSGGSGTTGGSGGTAEQPKLDAAAPALDGPTFTPDARAGDLAASPGDAVSAAGNLEIYWIDVEGGAATLIVTPGRELLLADTGWAGARDAQRIARVVRDEVKAPRIDYLLITHFHTDHVGGVADVTQRVPVAAFIDHGASVMGMDNTYRMLAGNKRRMVKPGDTLPLTGVTLTFVSAHGDVLTAPLPGRPTVSNPRCEGARLVPEMLGDENARSIGFVLEMGKFGFLNLGDLLWAQEHALACPINKIGQIDLYQVTHHGQDNSGATQLVHALDAVTAVVDNGPRKGGAPATYDRLKAAPNLRDIWQLHRALNTDAAHNTAPDFIANLEEGAADQGQFIKAVVEPTGRFTITNGRNGVSRTYDSR